VPTLVEEGKFSFGYKWTYSFSAGNLVFGPAERLSNPWNRGFNILQGLCEDVKEKDQVVRPWVYALPLLKFKSAPGPYSGWSYQMPVWGGPSYTPEGAAPTPDGGYQLGKFWIDLEITSPEAKIDLDPKDLQLLLLFAHDRPKVGDKITDEMVLKLRTWVKAIKASNLLPVLQNRYLKIHVWGHADKSGNISGKTPSYNQDLSTRRRKMVQTYLETQWDANVDFVFKDEGDEKATPGVPHSMWDKNAAVFIDQSEAEAALGRYYREGNTP
jgi:outer membrane protein OmpA-like peptidoglycan-associated protein